MAPHWPLNFKYDLKGWLVYREGKGGEHLVLFWSLPKEEVHDKEQ